MWKETMVAVVVCVCGYRGENVCVCTQEAAVNLG
jgi:hypothetical protein